ncbi:hypothetical protein WJ32_18785 (plasmid) [Burkholderia ubonensis]|uniref:Uncharacterized protein n=1 Tax=Burkholderia ubonensis TaxID=101571 RepID=A0A103R181_9BURK|nr:hypothetical protein [Burkholderia ubonensis]AOJ64624.1 hypothetical protein WJ32_18785 [Burkholderia ubonensis]KVG59352.1 hypothetical protein WJ33_34115 [Burkholderia ubonensis]
MKATISWWQLDQSSQTIDSLRKYLKEEGVAPWEAIQGMHSKAWISDPANNLWGAVVLWDSHDAIRQPLPPNRALELIGYPPSTRVTFDVEALVEQNRILHWLADAATKETR